MATDTAKAEGQKQQDPAKVETKSQADARGSLSEKDARAMVRQERVRRFNRTPIVPGAAGDPVEPTGDVEAAVDYDDDAVVTLDENVDAPSSSVPGSGPYDTQDPLEHASSVAPDKGAAARAGFGTVNAVVPIPDPSRTEQGMVERAMAAGGHREEEYTVRDPAGNLVKVWHNIDTGATKVLG